MVLLVALCHLIGAPVPAIARIFSWHNIQPVTITLLNGASKDLKKVAVIASKSYLSICGWRLSHKTITFTKAKQASFLPVLIDNLATSTSPYSWTPYSSLGAGTYGLSITQSGHINYSPQFTISGATGHPSTAGSSTATTARSHETFSTSTNTPGPVTRSVPKVLTKPTPAYISSGGLHTGKATGSEQIGINGTGIASPTGTSGVGQYAWFEGAAGTRLWVTWRALFLIFLSSLLVGLYWRKQAKEGRLYGKQWKGKELLRGNIISTY